MNYLASKVAGHSRRALILIALLPSVAVADQVFSDDLIVYGSQCVGLDCSNGENFGFDTLRVKENNTRIRFFDTSSSASFPTVDWQLTANETSNGGLNAFIVENIDAGQRPVVVDSTATSNALYLAARHAGFGTSLPQQALHTADPNTPALRLEQTGLAAFTPQTWDIGGNEVYFFVRDVTHGSTLPFKILPTAPTNALVIDAAGNLVLGSDTNASSERLLVRNSANSQDLFKLDDSGNLTIAGMLNASSSRAVKTNIEAVDPEAVLERLGELDILEWTYRHDATGARHIGAMAEDFYAAFGTGAGPESLAPSDMAGVALAAIRAQQKRIIALEQALAEREERIVAIEKTVAAQASFIDTRLRIIEDQLPGLTLTSAAD